MDDILPPLGGALPVGCPEYIEQPCYVPCQHVEETLAEYYNYENYSNKPRHNALITSFLEIQEDYIASLCDIALDICVQGELVNFPCVQCGYVIQRKFSPCPPENIICSVDEYIPIDPCISNDVCGGNICSDKCIVGEVDFQEDPELKSLYELIINALRGDYSANVSGVNSFLNKIWSGASVKKYTGDIMYIYLDRDATENEIKAWPIIKKAMPLPFGTDAKLLEII